MPAVVATGCRGGVSGASTRLELLADGRLQRVVQGDIVQAGAVQAAAEGPVAVRRLTREHAQALVVEAEGLAAQLPRGEPSNRYCFLRVQATGTPIGAATPQAREVLWPALPGAAPAVLQGFLSRLEAAFDRAAPEPMPR